MSISPIRSSGNLPAGKNRDDLKIPTMWTNLFDAALAHPAISFFKPLGFKNSTAEERSS
jgi:hypothetical protein